MVVGVVREEKRGRARVIVILRASRLNAVLAFTSMAIRCIVHFAQTHPEFRLPELESVAELFEFTFKQPLKPCESEPVRSDATVRYNWDSGRPFWIVDFESEAHIRLVCERCILVKSVLRVFLA